MEDLLQAPDKVPIANLFVAVGPISLGIAVAGTISGKVDPGKSGRIAAAALRGACVIDGRVLHMWPAPSASPAGEATAVEGSPTVGQAAAPAATPTPMPAAPTAIPPTSRPVPPADTPALPDPTPTPAPSTPVVPTPTAPPPTTTALPTGQRADTLSERTTTPDDVAQVTQLAIVEATWVKELAFWPDSAFLAIGTYGLQLHNLPSWELQYSMADLQWVNSCALSPDGTHLATATCDGVQIWATGGCGELLVTEANDEAVRVWCLTR